MGYDQASLGDNLFVWRAFEYVYNILHYSPSTAAAILSDAVFLRRGSLLRNCPPLIVCGGVGTTGAVGNGGVLSKGRVCRSNGVLLALIFSASFCATPAALVVEFGGSTSCWLDATL